MELGRRSRDLGSGPNRGDVCVLHSWSASWEKGSSVCTRPCTQRCPWPCCWTVRPRPRTSWRALTARTAQCRGVLFASIAPHFRHLESKGRMADSAPVFFRFFPRRGSRSCGKRHRQYLFEVGGNIGKVPPLLLVRIVWRTTPGCILLMLMSS